MVHHTADRFFLSESESFQRRLQEHLNAVANRHGAEAALSQLLELAEHTRFIADDLSKLRRYIVRSEDDPRLYLIVQHNSERQNRLIAKKSHRKHLIHNGCFLCPPNIVRLQGGAEPGWRVSLPHDAAIIWPNPYPFARMHLTVASAEHRPQAWGEHYGAREAVNDLVDLVRRFPRYVAVRNQDGAGASCPGHCHNQIFQRWTSHGEFPIESCAARVTAKNQMFRVPDHPIPAIAVRASAKEMKATGLIELIEDWMDHPSSSGNLIAMSADDGKRVAIFFCLRDRTAQHIAGLPGVPGALECAGEIVVAHEGAVENLCTYRRARAVLAAATPSRAEEFLSKRRL